MTAASRDRNRISLETSPCPPVSVLDAPCHPWCARVFPSGRYYDPPSGGSPLFPEKQIALLETFADQAVIAIENVRLFQELSIKERSLEQQTATSEILGVIASSPTDIQPVLDAIAKNAARVVRAHD